MPRSSTLTEEQKLQNRRESQKKSYYKNHEKNKEKSKTYYHNNIEKKRQYYQDNKEKIKQKYLENRDAKLTYQHKYIAEHQEQIKAYRKEYYQKKKTQ